MVVGEGVGVGTGAGVKEVVGTGEGVGTTMVTGGMVKKVGGGVVGDVGKGEMVGVEVPVTVEEGGAGKDGEADVEVGDCPVA